MLTVSVATHAQIVINEASNKNYSTIADEDGEYEDWLELYNAGTEAVNLVNHALTDDPAVPDKWLLPAVILQPGEFFFVYCSGKDRYSFPPATLVTNTGTFVPTTGWNTHDFSEPFYWDGSSNVIVNTCSYSSLGYITNSVFTQTETPFASTTFSYADGGTWACETGTGETSFWRPNMQLNGITIGDGTLENCNTCYPAPYGNWYWGARHQMLIRAEELTAAGLTEGMIESLGFEVVYTDAITYDYIEVHMNLTANDELTNEYINQSGYNYHSNFGISGSGETVYLFDPNQEQVDSITLSLQSVDTSIGSYNDGNGVNTMFQSPTPTATNNNSEPAEGYADEPVFSLSSGFYNTPISVTITNPNGPESQVYYTLDSSDPTTESTLYTGQTISAFQSTVLRARAFEPNKIPSTTAVATYFFNVNHITPILSVVTDNNNLYGPNGNFDNPLNDWLKSAYMEYFDSIPTHPLLFSQSCGMIQDGGWGGSRTQPQRSFRLKLTDGVLGEDPIEYEIIPYLPDRDVYSDFYLRNGSNQYLTLPYKDAAQVKMMAGETNNYYSAWRPISVYVNGQYFGLYELREKFNTEKFKIEDNATESTVEILSISAFYGFVFRAVRGDVDHYWEDYDAYWQIDTQDENYWELTDQYFDLKYYTDYIIGETWMGNVDWPGNNIKIYRSDATDYRWRFCLIDLELSLQPNSWTDCYSDHIDYMLGQGTGNPFIAMWNRGLQNEQYKNYFINRYADLMNTTYATSKLLEIENGFFNQTVVEMANEYQRWGDPWNVPGWLNSFNDNHLIFQSELACRSEQVRNHVVDNFDLDGQVDVTINVSPAGAGRIQLNTITPENLPWTGIYFNGIPVTMTAIANPGYSFDHWLSENIILTPEGDSVLVINVDISDEFTAYFTGSLQPTTVAINEINYNSDETQNSSDWFELHNYGEMPINLTGWSVTSETNQPRFDLPQGTVLMPDEYLVIVRDMDAFEQQYPEVDNFIGPFYFALSPTGGAVKLYNEYQDVFLAVNYLDSLPWPQVADGGGRTLELSNPLLTIDDPANWFAGCMFGSPGEAYQPCTEQIVFSEINFWSATNADAGDWIELRNISDQSMDLSGWIFRDDNTDNSFVIPDQTILQGGEMIVLSNNTQLFDQQHPEVDNRVGGFEFGFNHQGEMMRLYNAEDKLYFSMVYGADQPWPATAAGGGYTLELLDSSANVNSALNWFAGCLEGSPGDYYSWCETIRIDEEELNTAGMMLFPNPAGSSTRILFSGGLSSNAQVQLYDSFGRLVKDMVVPASSNGINLDLSDLASGVFVVRVQDGKREMHARLVIED
ncbi:MAG: lamin tail domain-containing protein [Flavobacteriales bacterium]